MLQSCSKLPGNQSVRAPRHCECEDYNHWKEAKERVRVIVEGDGHNLDPYGQALENRKEDASGHGRHPIHERLGVLPVVLYQPRPEQ